MNKPRWVQEDGTVISCTEKVMVLDENYEEIKQIMQDAFEDAILINCSETQIKEVLHSLVDSLKNPYNNV